MQASMLKNLDRSFFRKISSTSPVELGDNVTGGEELDHLNVSCVCLTYGTFYSTWDFTDSFFFFVLQILIQLCT